MEIDKDKEETTVKKKKFCDRDELIKLYNTMCEKQNEGDSEEYEKAVSVYLSNLWQSLKSWAASIVMKEPKFKPQNCNQPYLIPAYTLQGKYVLPEGEYGTFEDVMQTISEKMIGLALDKENGYDPNVSAVTTYFTHLRVVSLVIDGMSTKSQITKYIRRERAVITRELRKYGVTEDFTSRDCSIPVSKIALISHKSVGHIQDIIDAYQSTIVSIDDENENLDEISSYERSPEDVAISNMELANIKDAVEKCHISKASKALMKLRYYENKDDNQILRILQNEAYRKQIGYMGKLTKQAVNSTIYSAFPELKRSLLSLNSRGKYRRAEISAATNAEYYHQTSMEFLEEIMAEEDNIINTNDDPTHIE